jgi:ADP-ribose pyrophosphatase YjhB (NUDIX family)
VTGPHGPLPRDEYEAVYARVPRLTVEVVLVSEDGVLLSLRQEGPCCGLWHLPGGTVRFGERLVDAVRRVASDEVGVEVEVGDLLGVIEYPGHPERAGDWPVGLAHRAGLATGVTRDVRRPGTVDWWRSLPPAMHEEQRSFLRAHGLAT